MGLVRYLTWDNEAQAVAAAGVIEGGEVIWLSTVVLCELAWVLKRAYRHPVQAIADALGRIITGRNVELDRPVAVAGLRMLALGGDFADGVVRADARRAGCRHVVTFDQEFARLVGVDGAVLLGGGG